MVDVELYGGKAAMLEHFRARMLHALGAYRGLREVTWKDLKRLVFVCKGNICRSPYACARARALGVPAESFGLHAADGKPADPAALRNALPRGIDLSAHWSRQLDGSLLSAGDLVIVFEPRQFTEVRAQIGGGTPVVLLGLNARPVRPHIQDPYGMSDRYFQQCFSVIDINIAVLAERMLIPQAPGRRGSVINP